MSASGDPIKTTQPVEVDDMEDIHYLPSLELGAVEKPTKEEAEEAGEADESKIEIEQKEHQDVPRDRDCIFYELNDSWAGVSLVIGAPGMLGCWTARGMYTALLATSVVCCEVTIVYLLQRFGVAEPKYTWKTVRALQDWRVNVAHDYKYYNEHTGMTLAARVCALDSSLELSTFQMSVYRTIKLYLGDGDASLTAIGPLVNLMGIVMWILTILNMLKRLLSQSVGIYQLRRGATTVIEIDEGGRTVIKCISTTRKLANLALQAARVSLAIMIALSGCFMIAYDLAVSDLFLNAMKFAFILKIESLVYDNLLPLQTQKVVSTLQQVRCAKTTPTGVLTRYIRLSTFIGMVITLVTSFMVIDRHMEVLVAARDAICAGDLDFVESFDGLGVITWAYPEQVDTSLLNPRSWPDGGPPRDTVGGVMVAQGTYKQSVTKMLLAQLGRSQFSDNCGFDRCFQVSPRGINVNVPAAERPDCCTVKKTRVPAVNGGRFSVERKSLENVEDALKIWNPSCIDALDSGFQYEDMLQGAIGLAVNFALLSQFPAECRTRGCPAALPLCTSNGTCIKPTCEALKPYCNMDNRAGVRVRQLCSHTCGCDNPTSNLAMAAPADGCGDQCGRSGEFLLKRRSMPCVDAPLGDPSFAAFLNDFDRVRQVWPNDWREGSAPVVRALRDFGCEVLRNETVMRRAMAAGAYPQYMAGSNVCALDATWFPVKPVSYFCPVACGCRAGDPYCPDSCPRRDADTPLCPSYQKLPIALGTGPWADDICPMTSSAH
mmetsp:Transcript_9605/g.19906  ORF Transcript_9605/g.19906 Transcript_9605/m.19906 type:complete len:773 (-) Transcript_9605:125-2443(-)|eukprot:CAMPEP_0118943206 /NCGR_PEP_ID=MMETSP1169-20130426/37781_1 /TAXON_ID=36882 /ORGANISM="Pyramimonas obovata, Strain CCMP722" /LENGTH=772 /DNA_ID=CAMNT_0006888401 /DNA_START=358 /DNA_END=2676 /DNA_ORIENTATION=-